MRKIITISKINQILKSLLCIFNNVSVDPFEKLKPFPADTFEKLKSYLNSQIKYLSFVAFSLLKL